MLGAPTDACLLSFSIVAPGNGAYVGTSRRAGSARHTPIPTNILAPDGSRPLHELDKQW